MSASVPSRSCVSRSVPPKSTHARLAAAAAVVGAALMLAPPPAAADRDWDDDDRPDYYEHSDHHHKHKHARHHRHHEHGDWCAPRRYARPHVVYAYEPRRYAPPPRVRYYCDPCDRWYGSEASFHSHVHNHHRVARALLPAVIAATVFGAIYAGY